MKITVKQLTLEFGISDTYLQNAFRSVYGMPVISFIRTQKMQSAAQILIHTTRTIDEIAEEFGYENESKFSSAFKKIMGVSPEKYRKMNFTNIQRKSNMHNKFPVEAAENLPFNLKVERH